MGTDFQFLAAEFRLWFCAIGGDSRTHIVFICYIMPPSNQARVSVRVCSVHNNLEVWYNVTVNHLAYNAHFVSVIMSARKTKSILIWIYLKMVFWFKNALCPL